ACLRRLCPPPLPPTPLPYTTLFRSAPPRCAPSLLLQPRLLHRPGPLAQREAADLTVAARPAAGPGGAAPARSPGRAAPAGSTVRSEEHTSELQSRFDLVCRLLLEKK